MQKLLIIAFLILILWNLGAGLYYMMVDKGKTDRTVKSLTWRIGLSIALILLVVAGIASGIIKPSRVRTICLGSDASLKTAAAILRHQRRLCGNATGLAAGNKTLITQLPGRLAATQHQLINRQARCRRKIIPFTQLTDFTHQILAHGGDPGPGCPAAWCNCRHAD